MIWEATGYEFNGAFYEILWNWMLIGNYVHVLCTLGHPVWFIGKIDLCIVHVLIDSFHRLPFINLYFLFDYGDYVFSSMLMWTDLYGGLLWYSSVKLMVDFWDAACLIWFAVFISYVYVMYACMHFVYYFVFLLPSVLVSASPATFPHFLVPCAYFSTWNIFFCKYWCLCKFWWLFCL